MARLQRGENAKIDKINDLVAIAKESNSAEERNDALTELLSMFKPMMLSICNKWSKYFNDAQHTIKSFSELMADAEYWFYKYTVEKYTIDGDATYNKFIKDHIDQRIRYIYECQLKYYKHIVLPDPARHDDGGHNDDPLDTVIYGYSSEVQHSASIEDDIVNSIMLDKRKEVAHRIMEIVESGCFNEREKLVFNEVLCNGVTQEEMSNRLNVSRTRVVQILRKVKYKLKVEMEKDDKFWQLITQTDIVFDENYL